MRKQHTAAPLAPQVGTASNQDTFAGAQEALVWATEIMRKKRFPRIPSVYNGMARPEVVARGGAPAGSSVYAQALSIYQAVYKLGAAEQEILQLHVWGDYATSVRLDAALKLQEKWRQAGKRVRLSYRYSHSQLAVILGISKTGVGRKLGAAFKALADELLAAGLIE